MDLGNLIAVGVSALLGITAIWKAVSSILSKGKKYLKIAEEALELVNSTLSSLEDGKLETAEIEKVKTEYNELIEAIKA